MSKAFDFVQHEILLEKCERYGIRGKALNWLKDYLTNRQQRVEILGMNKNREEIKYKSQYRINTYGVPQGSILGPLLFLLYINDLPTVTKNKCVLFADDIALIINNDNGNKNFESKINAAVEAIIEWLEQNNLCVNVTKTKYINFSNYKMTNDAMKIIGYDKEIEEVDHTEFLGVVIDKNCNWKKHIENLCNRLNSFAFALRNLRKTVGLNAALLAYHGYVSSVLRYGLIIWGNSTDSNKAFIVQKKCLRAVFGADPLESCRPIFKKQKLLTLACLYILEIGLFVKKHPHLFSKADSVNDYKVGKISRDPTKLAMPRCRTAYCHKNTGRMTIVIFNKIPKVIRELRTNLFQKHLRAWLIENCFYTIKEFMNYKTWKSCMT